jgi:2-hydroxychromene-2-carboxylate isomerase
LRWRPFLLGPIFKAYGWNDSPFNIYAAKGRYMWRDLQRICDAEGLPLKLPPVLFPQNGGLHWSVSARAGFLPSAAPVCRELCRAEGHQRRRDASHDSGRAWCRRGGAALAAANAPETKEALKAQTAEAQSHKLFGAPSFTVGEELFWGTTASK